MNSLPPASITLGAGPLVAAAIHDGHAVRPELEALLALSEAERLRDEDPFTGEWTRVAPTRVIGRWSRFEVDLNRPRDTAVYMTPDDAWGLELWHAPPDRATVERSLEKYDRFYVSLRELLDAKIAQEGRFVVFDIHSYNHRRDGPDAPPAPEPENPEINVGTGTMHDRDRWAGLVERFIGDFSGARRPDGSPFDVRENVKFQGRQFPQWIHDHYPGQGCVLSLEIKKFFMDEWSGEPFHAEMDAIAAALRGAVAGVLEELARAA
jgi:N-formylglutamate deformylase